jgi:antitoxin MazE
MKSRVQWWGNCLAVRIPKSFAREAGLGHRSAIELRLDGGNIVIEPISPVPTLEDLLAGVTPRNLHRDFDWRPGGGREDR